MQQITEYWRLHPTATDGEVIICALYETDSGLEVRIGNAVGTLMRVASVVDDLRGRLLAEQWRVELLATDEFRIL